MSRDAQRALGTLATAALAVATLATILTVVRGPLGENDARALASAIGVLLAGGAALLSLALLTRGRLRAFAGAALLASAGALVAFVLGAWKAEFDAGNDYAKLLPVALAWSVATIVTAAVPLLTGDRRLLGTLFPAVLVCAVGFAVLATVLVWAEVDSEGWQKLLAVLGILMGAGFLATPALERVLSSEGNVTPR